MTKKEEKDAVHPRIIAPFPLRQWRNCVSNLSEFVGSNLSEVWVDAGEEGPALAMVVNGVHALVDVLTRSSWGSWL